mgnify:CR=1 FL=1
MFDEKWVLPAEAIWVQFPPKIGAAKQLHGNSWVEAAIEELGIHDGSKMSNQQGYDDGTLA